MKPTQIKINISKTRNFIFDANLSLIVWMFLFCLFPAFALFKESIFPMYYFWDANTIETFMLRKSGLVVGDSYASTAAFYNIFNVARDSFVFPIISSIIIISFFFWVLKKSKANYMTLLDLAMYLYCILLANVYMTLLSKDFIVLILCIIPFMFLARRGVIGLLIWSGIACFYGTYYRGYWFLVVALFWGFYIIFKYLRKPVVVFIMVFLALFALAIVFRVVLGVDLDNFRNLVNESRLDQGDTNARTMIVAYIPGGGLIIGWLNVYIIWIFMMIPLPLIFALSPFYLVISYFIIMLYYRLWIAIKRELKSNRNPYLKSVICLIIAFTTTQSIFEPDFGSYVRHLSPLYPLFFYVLFESKRAVTRSLKYYENITRC
jgi:hypothetical protein